MTTPMGTSTSYPDQCGRAQNHVLCIALAKQDPFYGAHPPMARRFFVLVVEVH